MKTDNKQYILITGGTGFIGSHIVDELIYSNYNIIIVDNLSNSTIENINKNAVFYKIDIKDNKKLEAIFLKYKIIVIIHLAAQISSDYSIKFPVEDVKENIIASINIINIAKKYKVKKIFVSSSAAVYGDSKFIPINENCSTSPISNYGISKLSMEKYIQTSGIDYIIFRLSNVYGPRQRNLNVENGVVTTFINNILTNNDINIYGDGNQIRDFIYVKDVAKIFSLFINMDNVKNMIINISTNIPITIKELYTKLTILSNKTTKVNYLQNRDGDIRNNVLDNKTLLKLIDFNFTDIEVGLNETLKYFQNLLE